MESITGEFDNQRQFFDEVFQDFPEIINPIVTPDPPVLPVPPTPVPPPPIPRPPQNADHELMGEWEYVSGFWLYFFGRSEFLQFFDFEDGTFGVYESESGEVGEWHIDENGNLVVDAGWRTHVFTYIIEGDNLTLIDSDGDTSHYARFSFG